MIRYVSSIEGVTEADLAGPFFEGWLNPPDAATHLQLLHGSDHVVLARHEGDDRIVGFATAMTDGVLSAFIPFVEVVADYRARGIGSELVRRIIEAVGPIYAIDAVCDPDLQPFYRHLGLHPGHAVMLRDYTRQGGR